MAFRRWPKYVPVAQRRAKTDKAMQKLQKKGQKIEPIKIEGRKIAHTFWGKAWCDHLEKFSDFENRLPRGRTYVRNGSVCHLAISMGRVEAIVSGTKLYHVTIKIAPLSSRKWKKVREQCTGQIGSMLELLQGRFSDHIMNIVTDPKNGLFPQPKEITFNCDCPDWASMCKHVAAVLYGVGARLDHAPELLFLLRKVDHEALIAMEPNLTSVTTGAKKGRRVVTSDLSDIFGIELQHPTKSVGPKKRIRKKASKKKHITHTKRAVFKPTAAAIRQQRKRCDMSVAEFAALLGVSPATVNNWERSSGKLNLRQRTLDALTNTVGPTMKQTKKKASKKKYTTHTKKASFKPTAAAIRRQRKQFDMSVAEFAALLGVSSVTVNNWERSSGKLNLRQRTLDALTNAAEPTMKQTKKKASKKKYITHTKKAPFKPTAAAIRRQRKQCDMSVVEFAALLGVSPATVNNWERSSGKLNLRQRTLEALTNTVELTKKQAKRKVKKAAIR
jgi:uncharacterized Zn finger protein